MVEKHIAGKVVNSVPLHGLLQRPAVTNRFEHRGITPNLGVARHAGLRGWQPRIRRSLDAGVAESAVDPQAPDVMLVAEWDTLTHISPLVGRPR